MLMTLIRSLTSLDCGIFASVALLLCSMKNFLNKEPRDPQTQKPEAANSESRKFSSSDLQHATRNFHPDNKLGRGEYSEVFKGILDDGTEVAVKKLIIKQEKGSQEFMGSVKLFTRIEHKNLVKLTGWCHEGGQKLLVFEYLEQKSLAQVLLDKSTKMNIEWKLRFNIAVGIARGLAHLHEADPQIIHGNLKATNVLLDTSFNPKIDDYALRPLFQPKASDNNFGNHVDGNLGYIAPEYFLHGRLTEKADTFSFGVLTLEIVSGRRNLDLHSPKERMLLLKWAWDLYIESGLVDLIDPSLGKEYSEDEVFRLIHLALLCTQSSPATRPPIQQVLAMMNGDDDINVFPSRPGIIPNLLEAPLLQKMHSTVEIAEDEPYLSC